MSVISRDIKRKTIKNQYFQKIRAILMFLVIFIHANYESVLTPNNYVLIFIRTIANTAVPVFFFLSGYFFNKKKCEDNPKKYVGNKIKYLFIPLVIWDLVYFLINYDNASIKSLLTFQAGWQLYFIVVLIQLIFISPFILKYWHNKYFKMIVFLITPITMIIHRVLQLKFNFSMPLYQLSIFYWVIYYVLGLEYENIKKKLRKVVKIMRMGGVVLFSAALTIVYAYNLLIYHSYGYGPALSQIDFMNMCFSLTAIMMVMKCAKMDRHVNLLSKIGDRAIGIYFIHLIVLELSKNLLGSWQINDVVKILSYSFLTLFASYVIIIVFSKLTKGKLDKYLGFGQ